MRIALVFGGRSGEHEVSVVSARAVRQALETSGHEVLPLAIAKDGRWATPERSRWVLDRSGDRTDQVQPVEGEHRLAPRLLEGDLDLVFPVLHGPYGEDGTIQGLLEMLDLPYVGCGVTASAVCMDKGLTKRLLAQAGLPTPAWIELEREEFHRDPPAATALCSALEPPLFVKPACLGSSVGISKIREPEALPEALERAFAHGHRVVVERGVEAREIEVPVLGNRRPRVSLPGEVVPGHEFYDYADKYLDDHCQLLAPAPLDEASRARAQELAVEVYRTLGCEGMARVDLFLERSSGHLLVNEVNTIPGFTPISMYPKLWEMSGLSYPQLVEELCRLALERWRRGAA